MKNPSLVGNSTSSKGTPCCSKVGIKRGPWTPEEDEVLANYIKREGEGRWRTLPKRAGLLRCGKSCRLRWMNYLRPSVKRGRIAPDEEDLILRLHRLEHGYQQQSQNQQVDKSMEKWKNTESATLIMAEPSSHGNEGDHMENCNEDMFSSFLDSLINENLLVNQHPEEQQPNNLVAPAAAAAESSQNLCHGDMWETELISAMVGFGNEPNSFNNHYHYLHQL